MAAELSGRNRRFLQRLQRQEKPVAHRALTAAAMPINLTSKTEARRMRVLRQGWQSDACSYIDAIPELSFAYRFLAHASSRMQYYPAILNPEEPDGPPIRIEEYPDIPPSVVEAATQAMATLGTGRQAITPMQQAMSYHFGGPGECFFVGQRDPDTNLPVWTIRSIDEFMIFDDTYKLREVPLDPQGTLGWIPLDPATTYAARMWIPWYRYQKLATSPMRALLDVSEELLLLSRDVRSTARSRLAGGGILKIPEGLRMAPINEDDDDPESEAWFGRFAEAMMTPISDDGVASAVVPIGISGDPESLAQLDHLIIDRPYSALAIELRAEAIGRIATGLDVPREVLEGMSDPNHWGAWLVSDDTFRHHIEPQVITQVDAMSAAYLRTSMLAAGVQQFWVDRACIWYDPVDLISKPDPMANAVLLHDRFAISNMALREAGGFKESDQPGALEIEFRMLQKTRTFPPNMVEAIFHKVDPELAFPPINTSGTIPGIGPQGEIPAVAPEPAAPALPASPPPPATPAPALPPDASATPPMTAPTEAFATPQPNPTHVRLSRKLTEIDSQLRARIQVAACAAMTRLLDKAGAKLRTRAADRKFKDSEVKTLVAGQPDNRLVASTIGPALVASLGFTTAPELLSADWSELKAQFMAWTEAAQKQALRVAMQLAGITTEDESYQAADLALSSSVAPAWEVMEAALNALAEKVLYTPDGDLDPGAAFDPNSVVPMGVVRNALTIAGGTPPPDNVVDVSQPVDVGTDPAGAMVSVNVPGQIGNGDAISTLLDDSGMVMVSHTWEHLSGTDHPFEPHLDLDGVQFVDFDDDVLANPGDWPEVAYLHPGDHVACGCDYSTVWGPAPSSDDSGEDSGDSGGDE
jgi:hypothetical protein